MNFPAIEIYRKLGFKIFPLAPDSKVPLKGSHGHNDATDNEAILDEWFEIEPRRNIGIATGAGSNLTVLDIDIKHDAGGPESIRKFAAQGFVLPKAPQVETPSGGKHLYYSFEPGISNSASRLGPGLDIRNDGGYIVAPPSELFHGQYLWIKRPQGPLPKLPRWLVKKLKPDPIFNQKTNHPTSSSTDGLINFVGMQQNNRNNSLYWAACCLAEQGKTLGEGKDLLLAPAMQTGLDRLAALKTIESGFRRISGENHV